MARTVNPANVERNQRIRERINQLKTERGISIHAAAIIVEEEGIRIRIKCDFKRLLQNGEARRGFCKRLLRALAACHIAALAFAPEVGGADWKYIGDFWCSAYCSCIKCCGKSDGITSSGEPAEEGTCAVDPLVIPLGSVIYVEGVGELRAIDTGGAVKRNVIDIYDPEGHRHALEWNDDLRGKHRVYILQEGTE